VQVEDIQEVDIADLLGRDAVPGGNVVFQPISTQENLNQATLLRAHNPNGIRLICELWQAASLTTVGASLLAKTHHTPYPKEAIQPRSETAKGGQQRELTEPYRLPLYRPPS